MPAQDQLTWPHLAPMRWSEAQVEAFHTAGIWRREGLDALAGAQARSRPEVLAVADETAALTWAQLDERLRAVAAGLGDAGVDAGAVVGIHMHNSVDHAVALFAIAAAGAVALEIPPDATETQVAAILARARAVRLLRDGDHLPTGDAARTLPGSDPDAVSLLLPTSGTTGTPKLAMRTANATLAMARNVTSRTHVGPGDVILAGAPLAGGIGYINGVCTIAEHGATLILCADFGPATLLELIERWKITALPTVPTIMRRMAEAAREPGHVHDTSSLRVVQSGGSYLHAETAAEIETRFGCRVISAYGAVDMGTPAMVDALDSTPEQRYATVGPPYDDPHCELAILDDAGVPLPNGQSGEVVMRGPNTALGYFEDPEATAQLFDREGWGHFGDLGFIDEQGHLRIVGRLKEIIIRGGKKLSIEEIEGYVRGYPGVRDVSAVPYADAELGERAAAVVVCEPWLQLSLEQLGVYLAQRGVPKRLWPERVELIDELPLSPQGKVRRRELADRLAQIDASLS